MEEQTDSQLLREYARKGSEAAFDTVMRRHIDFVYSAALRMVIDPHLAEDVTQGVFVALAGRARSLARRPVIAGWLHRTARNLAAKTVRTEVRRRQREQASAQLHVVEAEPVWQKIAPVLDLALGELPDADRDVVLLRFFENKTAGEIGARLRLSEAAAQKRVSRALEKLRTVLAREGVEVSATMLVTVIGTQAVSAAPANLAGIIFHGALAGAAASAGIGASLRELVGFANGKLAIASAFFISGMTLPMVIHHRAILNMRESNQELRAQMAQPGAFPAEDLRDQLARIQTEQALSKAQLAELLRLRGEVALLRRESQELARLRQAQAELPPAETNAPNPFVPAATWANVGAFDPQSALQTFLWAGKHRATNLVADLVRVQRDPEIPESDELDETFATGVISASSWFSGSLQAFRVLSQEADAEGMMRLAVELVDRKGRTSAHNVRFVSEAGQWFPVMHVWLQDAGSIRAALDVPAKFAAR